MSMSQVALVVALSPLHGQKLIPHACGNMYARVRERECAHTSFRHTRLARIVDADSHYYVRYTMHILIKKYKTLNSKWKIVNLL